MLERSLIQEKDRIKNLFYCNNIGEMTEYVKCNVKCNKEKRYMRITQQPVMIQSFQPNIDLPTDGPAPYTSAKT